MTRTDENRNKWVEPEWWHDAQIDWRKAKAHAESIERSVDPKVASAAWTDVAAKANRLMMYVAESYAKRRAKMWSDRAGEIEEEGV